MTKYREIVNAEYAKAKKLSADKKAAKLELNAAFRKYKQFITETYKPGRKAAFDAIAKAKAEFKAAKKTAVKKPTEKTAVKKPTEKTAVKKPTEKTAVKKAAAEKPVQKTVVEKTVTK